MSLQPGQQLAHYEIVELIGKGGMGEVYRAKDSKLGRDVAIKVLPDEFAQDEERLRRFQREAKVLASLNHPNIASIYGLEQSGSTHYLVLELVEGETLAERIARGPIPVDEALEIASKITEALEAAHEQGIVHRDLKPANIKLTPDGNVKVLDFGLAKVFAEETPDADSSTSPTLTRDATRAGVILGTAAYMSPEQAKGKKVDKRTDIFAFGAVLYEMLTGKKAFPGEGVAEVLASVIKMEPDWSAIPRETPVATRQLLARCLRKESKSRLRDIGDARLELESVPLESPALPIKRRPMLATVLAVLGLIGGYLIANFAREPEPSRAAFTRIAVPLPEGYRIAPGSTAPPAIAISPDGTHIAYAAETSEGRSMLFLRRMDSFEPEEVPGTEGAQAPFFSPDGQWLGFFARGTLHKFSMSGGAPMILCETPGSSAVWLADNRIVFGLGTNNGLGIVSADGGTPEELTTLDAAGGELRHDLPHALPDVPWLLYTVNTSSNSRIAALSFETRETRTVLEDASAPKYLPTGHLVFAHSSGLRVVQFDIDRLEIVGSPVPISEPISTRVLSVPKGDYAVSDEGTLVYVPKDLSRGDLQLVLVWVDRAGESVALVDEPGGYLYPRLSPDGRQLAVSRDAVMWLIDTDRRVSTRLTTGGRSFSSAWTPDGERLVANGYHSGQGLFWQPLDGGAVEPFLVRENAQYAGSWSPDGSVHAFVEVAPETKRDVWLVSADEAGDSSPFLNTRFEEYAPAFSPNGRFIAYVSDQSGRAEVYVRDYPGKTSRWQVSTAGGEEPVWARNGRELFYRNRDEMMVVDVQNGSEFVAELPRVLFSGPYLTSTSVTTETGVPNYDVSADGERFVMVESSSSRDALGRGEYRVVLNWFEELERLVPIEN